MSVFKEMDPDEIRRLLEGHQDVLTPESTKEQAFLKVCACPLCRSYSHEQFMDPARPFIPGVPLVSRYLRCLQCSAEWDPRTGLILKAPTNE